MPYGPRQNRRGCHGYHASYTTSNCPACLGITVQLPLKSLSRLPWNPCSAWAGIHIDHESFAELRPLALLGNAFYPVLFHRLAVSLHASSPHSVTLMQLRFASLAVINLRWDFLPQECARAGRTKKRAAAAALCVGCRGLSGSRCANGGSPAAERAPVPVRLLRTRNPFQHYDWRGLPRHASWLPRPSLHPDRAREWPCRPAR